MGRIALIVGASGLCFGILAAFQSAPISLVFPPGARATGLGEAFVGLADDANATFYNPAGLGLSPLANSWRSERVYERVSFVAMAAKKKKEFSLREEIWAGTSKGIVRYNGKSWESTETHLIAQDETLRSILEKKLDTEDVTILRRASQAVREANNIEMKRYRNLRTFFLSLQADSPSLDVAADRAMQILDLSTAFRDSASVASIVASFVDSSQVPEVTRYVLRIISESDLVFSKLVELKIPYSIAVSDSVTCMVMDGSEGLWIGTRRGLWHFEGFVWKHITILNGLPSDVVTCLAVGPGEKIAVGTDAGYAEYTNGEWQAYMLPGNPPADSTITALAYGEGGALYVGTGSGLYRKDDSGWTHFEAPRWLLDNRISALMYDSKNRLWIGSVDGVVIYDGNNWKHYKLPNLTVYTFAEWSENKVWIGTNKGVVVYTAGRMRTDENGLRVQGPPEWKAFHSKNAPIGDEVRGIAVHGKDVWLATDKGVASYDNAEREALLFWELLLPAMKLPDLYHLYGAFIYPTEDWGTFGLAVNYLNYGQLELTDEEGRVTDQFASWDLVVGLSYALALRQNLGLGLNIKYVHSALIPTSDENRGVGQTFAVDVAMLRRDLFWRGFDLGLHLQNMGPPIFYRDPNSRDPLPFTVRIGNAYRVIESPVHDLTLLLDLSRELAGNDYNNPVKGFWDGIYYDLRKDRHDQSTYDKIKEEVSEIQVNAGIEYWYVNFFAGRLGYLFDWVGQRYEVTIGVGLRYANLSFDFSYIHSPEGFMSSIFKAILDKEDEHRQGSYGVRHGQPRFSLIFRF